MNNDSTSVLTLEVDATPLDKASDHLGTFASLGEKAASSATRLEDAWKDAATTASSLGDQIARAGTGSQAAAAGFAAAGRGVDNLANQQAKLAANTRLTASQMQQLSFQLNDFFVQVASGGSPLTALIQQGSQLNGTFGGTAGTLRALGSLITPARLALGAFGGVLGAVAIGYQKGAAESDEFARAMVLTGNAAGSTVGQLSAQAKAISNLVGTQGQAAEVLGQLAASGRVGADAIGRVAEASIRLERAGGPAAAETAKQFAELGRSPLQAAVRLNEQTNFLTASLYQQIKALEEQGRASEAARVAQVGYADAVEARTSQLEARLGFFEKAWRTLGDTAKGAWDKILNVGRPDSPESLVDQAQAALDRARKLSKLPAFSSSPDADVGAKERELAAAKAVQRALQGEAQAMADKAAATKVLIDLDKDLDKSLGYRAQLSKDLLEFDSKAAIARRAVAADRLAEFDAETARQRKYIEQTSAATQQGIALELAGIEAIKQKRLDANNFAEQELKRRVQFGTQTQFAADREQAKLRVDSINAQVAALERERTLIGRQREPAEALKKNDIERNRLLRERQFVLDEEAATLQELIKLGERRFESPTEQFRIAERGPSQAAIEEQRQARLQIATSLQAQAVSLRDSNRELTLEASLIGKSAEVRNLALQQLRIQIQLEEQLKQIRATFPTEPASGLNDEDAAQERDRLVKARNTAIAAAQKNAADAFANVTTKANVDLLADLLDPSRPKDFGAALTAAFDGAGNALAKLTNTLQDYAAQQKKLDRGFAANRDGEGRVRSLEVENDLIRAQRRTQVDAYASMAGAAKGFFDQNTRGYKAMEAAETAFRAFQLASDLAKGVSAAAVGIANQAQGDPYTALPRMAVMAAAMASLGFATGFFGSSSAGSQATAAQRQGGAATGRIITADQLDRNSPSFRGGSVFGNDEARSASIAKSIELLENHARLELDYSRNQLSALEAIRDSMAGVANLVVRTAGITTGKNFNLQTGILSRNEGDPILKALGFNDAGVIQSLAGSGSILGKIGVFAQSLWGKVTQKIADSGLDVSGTIADVMVRQFADVEKTTSSFFGLRKKTTTETLFGDEKDVQALADQFGLIFKSIGDSVKASAEVLGREGGEALAKAIATFPVAIERLSLKDLKGDDLQEAIGAAIGAQADTIAQSLVPGLEAFQTVGQGYFETLVRVSSGIELAKYQLDLLNVSAIDYTNVLRKQGDVGAEIVRQSIALSETSGGKLSSVGEIVNTLGGSAEDLADTYRALVNVRGALIKVGESGGSLTVDLIRGAGGLDKLSSSLDTYFTKFFSPQEQAAANSAQLADQFQRLGLAMPATRAEFRSLADGLNDGTAAGAKLFAQVINLAEAFDQAISPAEQLTQTLLDSIKDALPKFLSPKELTSFQYDEVAQGLQKAGVNVSVGQLLGASMDDILAFARSFVNLSDGASEAEIAVVRAASALADLKGQATAAREQLEDAIAQNLPRLLSPEAQRTFRFQQIQSDLQDVGVSIGLDKLMGATKAQILAFAQSFVNLGDGASAAELAVVNAAGALGSLIDESTAAADARQKSLGDAFGNLLEGLKRGVSDAYSDVAQIIGSERQRLESEADKALNELEQKADKVTQTYSGLVDSLGSSLKQLMGDLAGDGGRAQAVSTLQRALGDLRSGSSVDADVLRDAASTAARLETSNFASALEFRRAQASTAALIRDVSDAAQQRQGSELAALADQQAKVKFELQKQTDTLDDQLKQARSAAGSLVSIDDGVKSVAAAIGRLDQSLAAARAATGNGPSGQWVAGSGADALSSAGGAVALRESGAKVEDTFVKGLKTSFTVADARAFVADRLAAGDIVGIYARARAEGIDSSTLDTLMGWAPGTSLGEALRRGLPAFEFGSNFIPETGLALVHKGERVLTAAQNQEVMRVLKGGGEQAAVEAAVRDLIAAVKQGTDREVAAAAAIAANTGKSARLIDGVVNGGASMATRAEA